LTAAATPSAERDGRTDTIAVRLFPTCLGDVAFPRLEQDVRVALGAVDAHASCPRGATCCGQPAFNAGHERAARRVARTTLRALDDGSDDPIVVPSGSCAAMMRLHWPGLFRGSREEQRARRVSPRITELTALLAARSDRLAGRRPRWAGRVGWHHSCHMLRELRLGEEPAVVLAAIEAVEIVPLTGAERCCGFGGTFSVRYPDLSTTMADAKLVEAVDARLDALVSADPGCLMQLGGRLSRTGSGVRPLHIATLLAESLS
jgi:L-lactate dehydrogenase complex protein LldE